MNFSNLYLLDVIAEAGSAAAAARRLNVSKSRLSRDLAALEAEALRQIPGTDDIDPDALKLVVRNPAVGADPLTALGRVLLEPSSTMRLSGNRAQAAIVRYASALPRRSWYPEHG